MVMAQHCGYARVAYNYALSAFKVGLAEDIWRTPMDIKSEFNARKDELFPRCRGLS